MYINLSYDSEFIIIFASFALDLSPNSLFYDVNIFNKFFLFLEILNMII